ncbi:MAG: hypothetical protein J6K14_09100 [Clostridia bacterium]|nr:hypothetical protein [Clostridia bacterium]
MQEEKKSIIGRLYFVRATLSKISLLNDKVISAKRKADGEIVQQENLVQRQKKLNAENREKIEEELAAIRAKRQKEIKEKQKFDPSSSKGDLVWITIWTIVFVGISILLNYFLFHWWINRDCNFWIGLLAFPVALVSLLFDYLLISMLMPKNIKKDRAQYQARIVQLTEEAERLEKMKSKIYAQESVDHQKLAEFKTSQGKALDAVKKTLSEETDQLFNAAKSETLIDERDWKHLDVIIYVLETGRAETMKEALQQADLFVRHEEIKDAIKTSALAICQTIRQSIDDLSYSIGLRLSELQTEMARIGDVQAGISAKFDSMIDAQQLNNALLEKAGVSSEQLAADVHRMRHISDEAYYKV